MSSAYSPLYMTSAENHGAYCVVSAAIYAIVLGVIVLLRGFLTWQQKQPIGWDDITFLTAAFFALVTVIIYPVAVNAGLGQHASDLAASELVRYYKLVYAAQLTGVAAIGASKISAVLLSQRAVLLRTTYFYSGFAAVFLWTVFSLIATAFQCGTPTPWVSTPANCSSRSGLQYTVTIFGMLTDVLLAVWIIEPVMNLNMSRYDRTIVITLFGTRIIIPCIAAGQLVALNHVVNSDDQPWVNLSLAIVTQAVVNLSVICTTLPRVNRFLYSLKDNLLFPQISDVERETSDRENSIARSSNSAHSGNEGGRAGKAAGWKENEKQDSYARHAMMTVD